MVVGWSASWLKRDRGGAGRGYLIVSCPILSNIDAPSNRVQASIPTLKAHTLFFFLSISPSAAFHALATEIDASPFPRPGGEFCRRGAEW